MRSHPTTDPKEMLKHDWRRWTNIVELVAHGRSPRNAAAPRAYRALHQRLIAACRELARSGEAPERAFYKGLEATIRPWLTPKVLLKADVEILGRLLERCRRIERELGVRPSAWTILRRSFPLVLAPASSVMLVFAWSFRGRWLPLLEPWRFRGNLFWFSLKKSSELEKLFALGVFLILLSIYSLSRTARS